MSNEELKKKIAEIIDTTKKPCECLTVSECLRYEKCKYQKREEWSCKAYAIAEALIAAGIGDVGETKEKLKKINERILLGDIIACDLSAKCAEYKYRAEVAERALQIADELGELCGRKEDYVQQAEKELAEEEKDD